MSESGGLKFSDVPMVGTQSLHVNGTGTRYIRWDHPDEGVPVRLVFEQVAADGTRTAWTVMVHPDRDPTIERFPASR